MLKALEKKVAKGKFQNLLGKIVPKDLRPVERTEEFFRTLGEGQAGSDILVMPAQFGLRRRGGSARPARRKRADSEFDLGVFAVGIMLLTHPDRLLNADVLDIMCAGDARWFSTAPFGDDYFETPCFGFADDRIELDCIYVDDGYYCGYATGFIPPEFHTSSTA